MIGTRSPLRISLGGGGTDLPSYYRQHGGFLIAGAIDRFVYVNVLRPFTPGIFLKYSRLEHVETIDEVQHPIIRATLRLMDFKKPQLEITALADIPAGTGLGSSGSFTTALLKALYMHRMRQIDPKDLADLACRIEIDILGEPTGKQDQYIAACGGITCFTFNPDDSVEVEPLDIDSDTRFDLEDNLLMFFTGFSRSAGAILKDQKERTQVQDAAMLANMHYVKALGLRSKELLIKGQVSDFGALMHEHWEHKKRRSSGMSMAQIDEWYELGRRSGAIGGKLVGAGGGGFLLFYAEDRNKLRHAMAHAGLQEVRFHFEHEGTKVVNV
jgi:D-glycero-alpha-D-manno-heptose-7-phosphate kinase